jgi:hypothetical protein
VSDCDDRPQPSRSPRRASLALLGVPALAAVVALGVWLSTPTFGPLVAYQLEIVDPSDQAGAPVEPGGPAARIELAPGRGMILLLRPHAAHTEKVDASAFVSVQGAPAGKDSAPLQVVTESVGAGALRLTLSAGALPEQGHLVVLVGRGALPRSPVGTAARGRDWQRFDVSFAQRRPRAEP